MKHDLNIARLNDQGYDSASNMCDEFDKLMTLITKNNYLAHYI